MKKLCYFLSLALLASCATNSKSDDPAPIPQPNVFVHYKLSNMGQEGFTMELKSAPHSYPDHPDSLITYTMYSMMGDWEATLPLTLPKRADVTGTIFFNQCGAMQRTLPQGASVLIEIGMNGKVLKRTLLEAAAPAYHPPIVNALTMSCADN